MNFQVTGVMTVQLALFTSPLYFSAFHLLWVQNIHHFQLIQLNYLGVFANEPTSAVVVSACMQLQFHCAALLRRFLLFI